MLDRYLRKINQEVPKELYTIIQFIDYSYYKDERFYVLDVDMVEEEVKFIFITENYFKDPRFQYYDIVETFKLLFNY